MEQERLFLHYSKTGNEAELLKLIENSVNIHCYDEAGNNALFLAAMNGHDKIVEILLNAGLDVFKANTGGHIPLIVAAMECHEAVVRKILAHSKLVSSRTRPSVIALMAANALELKGCNEVANLLRTHPG